MRVGASKEGAPPGTQDDLAGKDFENTSKKPGGNSPGQRVMLCYTTHGKWQKQL